MTDDTYLTIASASEGVYTEKRSKFIALAYPVRTVDEARAQIDACARRYYDARHVCYAYMLGPDRAIYRANDNGEPSGTAGKPILGQINSRGLTDVLIVVVRYFGGIKLGTGGLTVAYKTAAAEALAAATVVERIVCDELHLRFPYPAMNDVMRATSATGAEVVSRGYDTACTLSLRIRRSRIDALRARLGKIDGLTIVEPEGGE